MAAKKKQDGEPVIKKYRVLTPIRVNEDKERFEVGETFEIASDDAAELLEAGAIAEA